MKILTGVTWHGTYGGAHYLVEYFDTRQLYSVGHVYGHGRVVVRRTVDQTEIIETWEEAERLINQLRGKL